MSEFTDRVYKGKPDIYRRIFLPFVWLACKLKIHPNWVTILRFINMFIVSYFFLNDDTLWIGAILLQCNIILDITDGALARYLNKASLKGEIADAVLDHLYSQVLVYVPLLLVSWKWFLMGVIISHVAVYFRALCMEVNVKTWIDGKIQKWFRQDNNRLIALLLFISCGFGRPLYAMAFFVLTFIIIKTWILASHLIMNGVNIVSPKLAFNYAFSIGYYITKKNFFKNKLDKKYAIVRYALGEETNTQSL